MSASPARRAARPSRPVPHEPSAGARALARATTTRWFGGAGASADDAGWSLALLQATLDATTDGVLAVDRAGRILGCNRRFVELWQVPDDLLAPEAGRRLLRHVGRQLAVPRTLLADGHDEWRDPSIERVRVMECADGRVVERHAHAQRIGPLVVGRVWSFRDVTERYRLEDELLRRTRLDQLTGLANRAHFRARVEEALLGATADETVTVLFLDLDDFKRVNDSLGHAEGDALLTAVAERLRRATRGCDTVARLGGDEFAVLLRGVRENAVAVAERVTAALARPIALRGAEVTAGASVGIATSHPGLDVDALLRNADVAMYAAKARGKGQYAAFTPAMHAAVLLRLQLEREVRLAVAESQFVLHYQPVVRLEDGAVTGAEALVRWRHPERGLLAPAAFVPFAEEAGLVVELGRWVLREACQAAVAWQRPGRPFTIAVNVSGRQLQDPTLAVHVRDALADSGLPPACLSLEITEGVLLLHTEAAMAALHVLKALGVHVAVDDFGTGYASLACLHRFPIDVLKIDRSFVETVSADGRPGLARVAVSLAATLGLRAIAEGIEHEHQVAALRALGCSHGQGFHFAPPLPAEEMAGRL